MKHSIQLSLLFWWVVWNAGWWIPNMVIASPKRKWPCFNIKIDQWTWVIIFCAGMSLPSIVLLLKPIKLRYRYIMVFIITIFWWVWIGFGFSDARKHDYCTISKLIFWDCIIVFGFTGFCIVGYLVLLTCCGKKTLKDIERPLLR
eukprot:Anaeramoba_flamelloidesa571062_218.p1 GENE.a571062_218~~a571062_218.p1  ORF type:complete len:152 (-),score=4.26 a571062_218:148-582(-)